MKDLVIVAAFAPLLGALIAGLGGNRITRQQAHTAAIFSVLLSFLASASIFWEVLKGESFNAAVYTWLTVGEARFEVGFMIDRLTARRLERRGEHDLDLHPAFHRRDGQERAVPAARLAARLDGRPDADLGADPRRDHGHGRHLHGRAHVAALRALRDGAVGRAR